MACCRKSDYFEFARRRISRAGETLQKPSDNYKVIIPLLMRCSKYVRSKSNAQPQVMEMTSDGDDQSQMPDTSKAGVFSCQVIWSVFADVYVILTSLFIRFSKKTQSQWF